MKFYENLSGKGRVVAFVDRWTDRHEEGPAATLVCSVCISI